MQFGPIDSKSGHPEILDKPLYVHSIIWKILGAIIAIASFINKIQKIKVLAVKNLLLQYKIRELVRKRLCNVIILAPTVTWRMFSQPYGCRHMTRKESLPFSPGVQPMSLLNCTKNLGKKENPLLLSGEEEHPFW